jgi:hypothetical protein
MNIQTQILVALILYIFNVLYFKNKTFIGHPSNDVINLLKIYLYAMPFFLSMLVLLTFHPLLSKGICSVVFIHLAIRYKQFFTLNPYKV